MKKHIYTILNHADMDLSAYDDAPLDSVSVERMKQRMKLYKTTSKKTKVVALTASLCVLTLLGTAYASGLLGKAVESINLGHIQYAQNKPMTAEEITAALQNVDWSKVVTKDDADETFIEKDIETLQSYLCFPLAMPDYLPAGYSFDRAEFYPDENGEVKDSKYITLYFTNDTGDEIFLQERLADEETAYAGGADEVLAVEIAGVEGVLTDGHTLDWEKDNRLHCLIGHKLDAEELLKIAESM